MTTAYIGVAPGSTAPKVTLVALDSTGTAIAGNLVIPTLEDMTINNANDVFTWTQLNESSKLQIATLSTNSINTNAVLEDPTFFGNTSGTAGSSVTLGLFGLSKAKTKCQFSINFSGTRTISGLCYVTGLAPKVSAVAPVWVSPVTFTVTGDYTVV